MAIARGVEVEVDSAGTSREHEGQAPHRRTIAEAGRRGFDVSRQRARQLRRDDFDRFDLILTADDTVDRIVRERAPAQASARIIKMTEVGPDANEWPEVPDPYFGTDQDYVLVFDLLERALGGLLDTLAAGRRP